MYFPKSKHKHSSLRLIQFLLDHTPPEGRVDPLSLLETKTMPAYIKEYPLCLGAAENSLYAK